MKELSKYWWLILVKGIILILLAIYVFSYPAGALLGLALYIGISLLLTGFLLIVTSISNRKVDDQWGWRLAEGIIDVFFAFILLSSPALTATTFPFVVGFWMIFYGIMLFSRSFEIKKMGDDSWWMSLIGGILVVIFGYFIMSNILIGEMAITYWIGFGFMLVGLINVFASFKIKKLHAAIS